MWRLIWFLQGYVQAELRGASPEWALERLSNARVAFLRVQRIDDFTIALLILRKDVLKAEAAAQKAMCELAVVQEIGFGKTFGGLWRRRLFALGLVLCVTVIGIPFGLQQFKLAKLALLPFGAEVVIL